MSAALLEDERDTLTVRLVVNGQPRRVEVEPRTHLADLLRESLGLTGTHLGCEHGICGACTVLLDGEPARSCLTFGPACHGAEVTTIEGLDDDEIATELRAAFTREHALQCGYCTPGMLITARDLVLRLPEADERRVRLGFSGNLCRCTGYAGIVRATLAVISERRTRGIEPSSAAGRALGPVGARLVPFPSRGEPSRRQPSDRGGGGPILEDAGIRGGITPSSSPQGGENARTGDGSGTRDGAGDFTPAHTFDQSFAVPFRPDEVFALFGRVEEVAACLPGAVLSGQPATDRIEGAIRVGLGPIVAEFRGTARIARDDADRSGRIVGAGQDRGGRSATQGVVSYRVRPGERPGTSRVELAVGYTLTGPLAQFGRPGLVRDLAGRITAEFARNLEARLGGRPVALGEATPLGLAALVAGLLRGWTVSLFRRARRD